MLETSRGEREKERKREKEEERERERGRRERERESKESEKLSRVVVFAEAERTFQCGDSRSFQ